MSAKKKSARATPTGTPTLFSFFSPAGRGARFERPGSGVRPSDNSGGFAKENVQHSTPKKPADPLKFDDNVVKTTPKISLRSPSPSVNRVTTPKTPADPFNFGDNVVKTTPNISLPSPSPGAKRVTRRIVDSDNDSDDCVIVEKSPKRLRPTKAAINLETMAFSVCGSGEVDAIPEYKPAAAARNKTGKVVDDQNGLPSWQTNPRDSQGRRPDHPDYDPTTIMVPANILSKMTPAQQQYWEVKKDHFDMVLFFKVGKFYELFDADALIGNQHLNLLMMKGDRPHVGFPEKSFDKYAERLVQLGYKVARVEQVETPNELKERNTTTGSKSKVVNRELCSVLTKGTLTDSNLIGSPKASFLLAIVESESGGQYGVCYCDTATARFHIGEFTDDPQRTRFRTLLACVAPSEIVVASTGLQQITHSILKKDLPMSVSRNSINRPWDYDGTMESLRVYFPDQIPSLFNEIDSLGVVAFGNIVQYLQRCLLDEELVKIGVFLRYDPNDSDTNTFLALDGQTISNLEIVQNSEGGLQGSLLEYIDHCVTPFGHRRLREWIIRPLVRLQDINQRLDAVENLIQDFDTRERLRTNLKALPDLGRMLSRIHAYSCGRDSKAVMYENITAARLTMFLDILDGFRRITSWLETSEFDLSSDLLRRLTTLGEEFPDLRPALQYLDNAFDIEAARREGIIIPAEGIDPDYDDAENDIKRVEAELANILVAERKALNERNIEFVHKNAERYQLEVADHVVKRLGQMPDRYEKASQRKGFVRYYTAEIRSCVADLERANEKRSAALSSTMRRIFAEFCQHHSLWNAAVSALSDLDSLCALALASESMTGEPMTRPVFVDRSGNASLLELRGARHPSLLSTSTSFIPNDTLISSEDNPAPFLLVTGPNMGGKSTLLRQTCLCVILAQLGCYVPAESCRLTPVDRIFTRVGACDRILSGQSTFYVELEETGTILRHATRHSLVILDELGRGTSTFDGTAIAYAVAYHLSHNVQCRTLFATHYHVLSDTFRDDPNVAAYHMASQPDPVTRTLVFLYKFIPGVCPASFGINIAKMAGLPREITLQAEAVTQQFENIMKSSYRDRFNQCVKNRNADELRKLCRELSSRMIIA